MPEFLTEYHREMVPLKLAELVEGRHYVVEAHHVNDEHTAWRSAHSLYGKQAYQLARDLVEDPQWYHVSVYRMTCELDNGWRWV